MKSGQAIWVPVEKVELVEQYESEGWKIVSRWSYRPGLYDSYLMVREISDQKSQDSNAAL